MVDRQPAAAREATVGETKCRQLLNYKHGRHPVVHNFVVRAIIHAFSLSNEIGMVRDCRNRCVPRLGCATNASLARDI